MSSISAVPSRQRWATFVVCCAVAALTLLDVSKVNVAVPSVERALAAGPVEVQLFVAGYALAFGLVLVPAGRLGDRGSRRILLVVGLGLFGLASLLCAVAPATGVLLVGRALQGIAAGIQLPQAIGLIQQLFTGAERGRAFAAFGATIGVATALGPTLGGLLIQIGGEQDGWRWLFWMNVPLAAVAIGFALLLVPKRQQHTVRATELDLAGITLVAVAVVAFLLPFVLTTGNPDDDPRRWLTLVVFVAAGAGFVGWEQHYARTGRSPVLDVRLLPLASYRNGIVLVTLWFAATPTTFLVTTLFLQQSLGLPAVWAGVTSIPFALLSAVTAAWSGRHIAAHGRTLIIVGVSTALVGTVLVLPTLLLPDALVPWFLGAAMGLAGAGGGLVTAANQTLTLSEVPVEDGGVAGSFAQLGQRVGGAVGIAAATAVYFATLQSGGTTPTPGDFGSAATRGLLVILGFLVLCLAAAILDALQARSRSAASHGAEPDSEPNTEPDEASVA